MMEGAKMFFFARFRSFLLVSAVSCALLPTSVVAHPSGSLCSHCSPVEFGFCHFWKALVEDFSWLLAPVGYRAHKSHFLGAATSLSGC